MGKDIHVRIAKYNPETNKYKEICLYRLRNKYDGEENKNNEVKDPYVRVSCYSLRNYEMFDILDDNYGDFPCRPVSFNSLDESFKEDLKWEEEIGCFHFSEVLLPEIELYLIKHPTVTDYDNLIEDEEAFDTKTNPVKYFYEKILNYINLVEEDFVLHESYYKVIYYFDC